MATIRFEIVNADGGVEVDNAMMSSPAYRTPVDDAVGIAAGFPPGWRVRLWKDVPLAGGLPELGDPHAEATVPYPTADGWQRRLPLVGQAGDCGGDVAVTSALSARWVKPLADGAFALITRAYYVASQTDDRTAPYHLACETGYLICTDPADPASTEQWADYTYTTVADGADPDDGQAIHQAIHQATLEATEPTDDEWYRYAPEAVLA